MMKKLNSLRVLEAQGMRYEVLSFPDTIRSAVGVATYYGLSSAQVYKTLVVVLSQGKPALVLIAGDRELQLKLLAQALGEKKLRMATQKEAEAWTGLKVGGISALALCHRGFPVYIDRAAGDCLKTGPEACWQVDTFSGHLTGAQSPQSNMITSV